MCERESLRTLAVREIKYKREDVKEHSDFWGGQEEMDKWLLSSITVFVTFPLPPHLAILPNA